ncbi:MAG: hypothetical protein LBC47_06020 [Tannerella sp.]|jgi:hypothetical protein|nr:hypothetical protein [Tannerella sp.]
MAKNLLIDSPINIITGGTVPTTTTLKKGELAYGTIGGKVRYFGNATGSAIIELTPKEYTALANGGITINANGEISVATGSVTEAMLAAALATKINNVLAKDNTAAFTPTGDYNPATKKYVDDKVSALGTLLTLKGTKTATSALPSTGNKTGDVWLVGASGAADMEEWVWDGTDWEKLGTTTTVDLSGYYTSSQTDSAISTAISNNQSLTAATGQSVSIGGTRTAATATINAAAAVSGGGLKVTSGALELDTDNITVTLVTNEI